MSISALQRLAVVALLAPHPHFTECKLFSSGHQLNSIKPHLHVIAYANAPASSVPSGRHRDCQPVAWAPLGHSSSPSRRQELQLGLLMMLFYASLGTVLPYLPIFYRKLGLSEQEVGALGAVNPFVTLLLTPIWAALADRYNIQKTVMISTFALSAFSRVGYIYLPPKHAWLTGVLVAWSAVLSAPAKPLLDAAVMQLLRRKSAYGRARLFGQIGFGVGSYISGRFVGNNLRNMAVAHLALAVPTAYAMYRMIPCSEAAISDDAVVAAERKDFALEIKNKFFKMGASRQRELLIFFGAVLAIGIMSGIVENFALNRAIEISAITGVSNHFGMIPLAASLAGAPLFWISGRLISQFGVPALLGASLLSYLIRLLLYAYMTAVWQAIPAEMLRGATFATFWAATTYYVYSIAPERHKATMLGVQNAVYTGLGQSSGALLGGWLCGKYGIPGAFRRAAVGCAVVFIGYCVLLSEIESPNLAINRLQDVMSDRPNICGRKCSVNITDDTNDISRYYAHNYQNYTKD